MSGKIASVVKENIGGLIFSVALGVFSIIAGVSTLEHGVGRFIVLSILFIPVIFIAWVIGNAIRKAVHPDFVVTSGFWGLVKERIFWRMGPQVILSLIVFAVLTNIAEGSSSRRDSRADQAANPSAAARAASGGNNASTAPQFLDLSKEEFIKMVAGDNQFEEVDVSRLATMIRRGSQYLRVTGTLTEEVLLAIHSDLNYMTSDTIAVLDISAVQGWDKNGWRISTPQYGPDLIVSPYKIPYVFPMAKAIILGDSLTKIPYAFFEGYSNLKAVYLSNSITSIGDDAFKNSGIREIAIPPSVTEIGEEAFRNCTELRYVYFSENSGLETIGHRAFARCEALYSIAIPASLRIIGGGVFSGEYDRLSGLESITIPENSRLEVIMDGAFAYTRLTSFTFPRTIREIGSNVIGEQVISVIINAVTPPAVTSRTFPRSIQTIHVPAESLSAYQDAWFDYEFTFDNQLQSIR